MKCSTDQRATKGTTALRFILEREHGGVQPCSDSLIYHRTMYSILFVTVPRFLVPVSNIAFQVEGWVRVLFLAGCVSNPTFQVDVVGQECFPCRMRGGAGVSFPAASATTNRRGSPRFNFNCTGGGGSHLTWCVDVVGIHESMEHSITYFGSGAHRLIGRSHLVS